MGERKRRARRKPGDLNALKKEVWGAILTASELLDHDDAQVRLRAVHAVSQSAGVYRTVVETCDLERRLSALERNTGGGF